MSIIFHSLSEKKSMKHKLIIKKCLKAIISEYDRVVGDINIIFGSDDELLELNQKYLNHNYFTDVITFNFNEKNIISGDIYISYDRVKENSERYNTTFFNELSRVIVHGILHLLGFDDRTENQKGKMKLLEERALDLIKASLLK